MTAEMILQPSKKPERVLARSLLCYWAVTEPGLPGTEVGKGLGNFQPTGSKAVGQGANVEADLHLSIEDS